MKVYVVQDNNHEEYEDFEQWNVRVFDSLDLALEKGEELYQIAIEEFKNCYIDLDETPIIIEEYDINGQFIKCYYRLKIGWTVDKLE